MGDDKSDDDKPAEEETTADGECCWEDDETDEADEDVEVEVEDEVLFITSDIDQIFGLVEVVLVEVVDMGADGEARLGLTAEGVVDLLASPPEVQDDVGLDTPGLCSDVTGDFRESPFVIGDLRSECSWLLPVL